VIPSAGFRPAPNGEKRAAWETLQAFAADPAASIGIARAIFDRSD
jgi:hypothetical protein